MMKHYKLLKDLPGIKAGAIFHRKTNETMQVDMLNRVDDQGTYDKNVKRCESVFSILTQCNVYRLFNWRHQCLGFSFVYRIERRWKSAQSGVADWLYEWRNR